MQYLPILQTALKEDRFVLFVQPIVPTTAGPNDPPSHYEFLLRVPNENGQISAPYKFILAAERYDMMRDVDRWIIRAAMQNIASLNNHGARHIHFAINLSGQSAVDPALPQYIAEMLEHHGIDPTRICFELTETAVVSDLTQVQKLIAFLRELGCTIALDDFGSGVSSFGYLKNLQVDYLKIDGQFVKELTTNPIDLEMVRSINNVGRALGIKTIAEFVESQEILEALADMHVDYAQGYFTGRPQPVSDLISRWSSSVQAA